MDLTLGNFFGVMSILISFVCVLLAGFLLSVPTVRRQPNTFLALFLLLTAIEMSGWLWVNPGNANSWSNGIRVALGFLQMPVFFGFFVSSCYSDFALRRRDIAHLIPCLLALVLIVPGSQIPFAAAADDGVRISVLEADALWIGSHISYYGYMSAVLAVLWQFRSLFREHHSGARSEMLIWLTQLAVVSLIAHTLILVRNLLAFTAASQLVLGLQVFGALLALAITSWIALKSLLQPHLFRDVDRRVLDLGNRRAGGGSAGQMDARQRQVETVLEFMDRHEPYLDPRLNLASLADQLAMTPREVSELLNQSTGMHFFDFVNGYRVRKAQDLLLATPRQSVLEILYAVGFNSKSSFNTAFRKHAGVTPSAYRERGSTM
ncbi:helix-turn-helix domain-containing protein [Maricaulis sp.]|uniref:helix-turn-helix domain-containing protein n=1 Tax=Maricaulis sp. TaxID=1486257 RepID=UPI003A8DE156